MIKTFSDNIEPVQVELIDNKGNKITKTAKFLSNNEVRKMGKLYDELKDEQSTDKSLRILQEQMAFIFGGKEEDYGKYSPMLMKDVIAFVIGEVINPTSQVQGE